MTIIRPERWVLWPSFERSQNKEINQVLTRKWRDRYSALRNRPAIKPYMSLDTLAGGSSWTAMGDDPYYMGIPNGAQRLIARAQIKLNMTSDVTTSASYRVTLGSYVGSPVQINLGPTYSPNTQPSLLDGDVTSNDDTTWFNVTSIIPNPLIDDPFVAADWNTLFHQLSIEIDSADSNIIDLEVRIHTRQWSWVTEDYLPTIPPAWQSGEYA